MNFDCEQAFLEYANSVVPAWPPRAQCPACLGDMIEEFHPAIGHTYRCLGCGQRPTLWQCQHPVGEVLTFGLNCYRVERIMCDDPPMPGLPMIAWDAA